MTGRVQNHCKVFDLNTCRKEKTRRRSCFSPARLRGIHAYLDELFEETIRKKNALSFDEMCLLGVVRDGVGALSRSDYKDGVEAFIKREGLLKGR